MNIVEPVYAKHAFEPLVTLTLINERAIVAILNVCFDKAVPKEAEAAAACYAELSESLCAAGYIPYRTGPQGMARLRDGSSFWDVASRIKRALDPQNIMNPGKIVSLG